MLYANNSNGQLTQMSNECQIIYEPWIKKKHNKFHVSVIKLT